MFSLLKPDRIRLNIPAKIGLTLAVVLLWNSTATAEKLPVPDADAQRKARQLIVDVYGDELNPATSAGKATMARKLLQQAIQTNDNSDARYVLFQTAGRLAVAAGDASTAVEVINSMARWYEINASRMKVKTIEAVSRTPISSEAKLALAEMALDLASSQAKPEPADAADTRRSFLQLAGRLAIQAGDARMAIRVIDAMAQAYDIDALDMKVKALEAVVKSPMSLESKKALAELAISLSEEAVAADDFKSAARLNLVARTATKAVHDRELLRQITTQVEKVQELQKAFEEVRGAIEILKQNPDDPQANARAGAYYCFAKGNWTRGLPMLALGNDPVLSKLARTELTKPDTPAEQVALADAWWDLVPTRKGRTKKGVLSHAAQWYATALPKLSGLTRDRVEKRLKTFRESGAGTGEATVGETGIRMDSPLSSRSKAAREALVRTYGGSPGSEKAVASGLKWLAEHQMPDGGWSFEHHRAPECKNQCRNPGKEAKARIAATAMAILPFLGAGQTHKGGEYRTTVKNGIDFLVRGMKVGRSGGSMHEPGGRMYSHGLASIALCEAYAMTRDKGLHRPAQAAVNFISYAQDPIGGGWRYEPRQRGDTSVFSWQMTALKCGQMAHLRVPPVTVKKAFQYLDAVQANSGANYGYTGPGEGPATTAIGLLCRMYLGWKKDNPALQRGVKWISNRGPSKKGNMYYNYYATQVMKHWEGEEWKKWNNVMRDHLVNTQATAGHEKGSWHTKGGDHGSDRGGRLYCTSMCLMVLETYYRYPPIYRNQPAADN